MASAPIAPVASLVAARRGAWAASPSAAAPSRADAALVTLVMARRRAFRAAPLPEDLEAAAKALYQSSPALAAAAPLFNSSAKGDGVPPFVLIRLASSVTSFESDTSTWSEARLRLDAVAATAAQAASIRLAIHDAFVGPDGLQGASLSFAGGVSSPLLVADKSDSAPAQRLRGGVPQFWATILFRAQVRSGRP